MCRCFSLPRIFACSCLLASLTFPATADSSPAGPQPAARHRPVVPLPLRGPDGRSDPPGWIDLPCWTPEREELTRAYSRIHTGDDRADLPDPRVLVIHTTGNNDLKRSLDQLVPVRLHNRPDIAAGGGVNVGVHWLIAPDGTWYRLIPEDRRGRHVIGLNHTALGIEMVAEKEHDITPAQKTSCLRLVRVLLARHPGISVLIGHQEYRRPGMAHLPFVVQKDASYVLTDKTDPGRGFMAWLRGMLGASPDGSLRHP